MRTCFKLVVCALTPGVDADIGSFVSLLITVVRCREHSRAKAIMLDLVPLLANLVTSQDTRHTVQLAPPLGYVWTEAQTDTALRRASTWQCLRVGPEHLAHQAFAARLFAVSGYLSDLVQCDTVSREQAAVDDEETLVAFWGENGF